MFIEVLLIIPVTAELFSISFDMYANLTSYSIHTCSYDFKFNFQNMWKWVWVQFLSTCTLVFLKKWRTTFDHAGPDWPVAMFDCNMWRFINKKIKQGKNKTSTWSSRKYKIKRKKERKSLLTIIDEVVEQFSYTFLRV